MVTGIKRIYRDIGELYRRLRRVVTVHAADPWINTIMFILSIFGIVMIGDTSIGMAGKKGTSFAAMNMIKQSVFVVIGWVCLIVLTKKFNIRKYVTERFVNVMYVITLCMMLVCRLWNINGAYAWIKIPGGTLQPAEFMKIIMILALSYYFGKVPYEYSRLRYVSEYQRAKLNKNRMIYGVVLPFVMIGVAFIICGFYQKDLGTALILGMICYMLFCATSDRMYKKLKVIIPILIGIAGVIFVLSGSFLSHQVTRFDVWLHPRENYSTSSYQTLNGLVGYVTGRVFGLGFTKSVLKFGYIPEAQNDFISAIIVEEFGLIGFLVMITLYSIVIYRLIYYACKVESDAERLTLIGVASYFFFHLFVNIGGVSGLIPMTGVPLLLLSMGGSSTISALMGIGICQNIISRYNVRELARKAEETL